jgi:hypothetical protein
MKGQGRWNKAEAAALPEAAATAGQAAATATGSL